MRQGIRLGGAALSVTLILGHVGWALAEEAAAPAAEAAKDVVRLKNGGMLRGTISELVPGESVVIVTATGKTREFPMAEVDYAGPADKDPGAKPQVDESKRAEQDETDEKKGESAREVGASTRPYVTIKGKAARLHLLSEPEGLTFHRQSATATSGNAHAVGYDRLCTAPCDIELPAGTEQLSLSQEEDDPVTSESVSLPAGDSEVVGSYVSKSGLRIGGVVVLIAGIGAGAGLMAASLSGKRPNVTLLSLSLGVGLGGTVAGSLLMIQRDKASFEVRPKHAGAVTWPQAHYLVFAKNM